MFTIFIQHYTSQEQSFLPTNRLHRITQSVDEGIRVRFENRNLDIHGDIYISLTKLLLLYQINQLFHTTHNEGWFQGHVYADLFDAVFLFDPHYTTKRTECLRKHYQIFKETKQIDEKEKDVKIDLILFNSQLGDVFSCEDKPTKATASEVAADIKKGRDLREKRLLYIRSLLPYQSCIQHIEVLSAQFHGLVLTVYGSRMTEDGTGIVHYQKCTATIPSQPTNMPQMAYFLLIVMSLQRAIILNFKKLTSIYEAGLEDSIGFLASSSNVSNMYFREDSPATSTSSNTSNDDETSVDSADDWAERERSRRVLALINERIQKIGYEEDILTCDDWESLLLFDDA